MSAFIVELAELAVQKRADFLAPATQGRPYIRVIMRDGLRLHALGTRFDGAADIIGPALGPVHIGQMHLDPRQTGFSAISARRSSP